MFELEDLRGQEIEGQFYSEELVPVRITKQTTYKIDKLLDKSVRRGLRGYLFDGEDTAQNSILGFLPAIYSLFK